MSLLRWLASKLLAPEAANAAPAPWNSKGLPNKEGPLLAPRGPVSTGQPGAAGEHQPDKRAERFSGDKGPATATSTVSTGSPGAAENDRRFAPAGRPGQRLGSLPQLRPVEVLHHVDFVPVLSGGECRMLARCLVCQLVASPECSREGGVQQLDEVAAQRELRWPRVLHVEEKPRAEGWA